MSLASPSYEKSTTDRLPPVPFPGWVKSGFQATSWISPPAAARLARRWFFSPGSGRARRRTSAEETALAQATRFTLTTPRGPVQGYAWGRGPAVLLVHGWAGNAGQMTPLVPALLARGLRAVALDMPGHGASAGDHSSVLHFSDAIESAVQVLGPLRGVMAHSFGAAGTTYALARGLAVDRVVFFAPPVRFETFWTRFRAGLAMAPEVWDLLVHDAERWLGVRFADLQPHELAPSLSTPLLVLHDANDGQVLCEEGAELAALWRGARFEPTRGLGHLKILRDAGTIARAVGFLFSA